ncbi:hypothetical protein N8I74_06675 [Chitiniphilus purpureus]|uniref:Transposase n=1 Tax=Chitiniphilus purpureus TaxID=2981137 RepID=A0ABY6DQR9_9NEIS|nr:hypothetical protein [Chitiniphilus sp. CD1]UXY16700.1 hypothetical protein N8I74_06675 [Chitiniphilus sp. CD1]
MFGPDPLFGLDEARERSMRFAFEGAVQGSIGVRDCNRIAAGLLAGLNDEQRVAALAWLLRRISEFSREALARQCCNYRPRGGHWG